MLICIYPIGALWDYPFINLSIFLGRFLNPDLLTSFNFYILSSPLVPMVVFLGLAAWLPAESLRPTSFFLPRAAENSHERLYANIGFFYTLNHR